MRLLSYAVLLSAVIWTRVVKNHPFVDGNKRSGAFAFVWFLKKASFNFLYLTPEALTALTLLVAESAPGAKTQMIGLILLILSSKHCSERATLACGLVKALPKFRA